MVEMFTPTRRRAERFARALEGRGQVDDARVQELVDTVSRLAAVPLVEPRAEFRDSLRERLMAAAETELAVAAAQSPQTHAPREPQHAATPVEAAPAARRRRRLVTAATALVLVGGGTGVAAASEQALPGDVLYPVKRTIETAQVSLASGDRAEGEALLERADTRLDEATSLGGDGDVDSAELAGIRSALEDFTHDASAGGSHLLESYQADGERRDVRTVRDFTSSAHEALGDLATTLPPSVQPQLTAADETVVTLDDMARQACLDCSSRPVLNDLPLLPVSLPELADADQTLDVRRPESGGQDATSGQTRQTRPGQAGGGQRSTRPGNGPRRTGDAGTAGGGGATAPQPSLPDVGLTGPSPATGGSDTSRPRVDVDLGNLLDPTPTRPRRTSAPGPGDVGKVTEPLTDPLTGGVTDPLLDGRSGGAGSSGGAGGSVTDPVEPLLDGAKNSLGSTRDGLL